VSTREHKLAAQQAPKAHEDVPVQLIPHERPAQCTFPVQDEMPVQSMTLASDVVVIGPHDDGPEQAISHVPAVQVTPPEQEAAPQLTEQEVPPQATVPQELLAEQSMVHTLAELQSMLAVAPAEPVTVHGMPGGQVTLVQLLTAVQSMTHVPSLHVPAVHFAAHAADASTLELPSVPAPASTGAVLASAAS
jgi:hypothetical protein